MALNPDIVNLGGRVDIHQKPLWETPKDVSKPGWWKGWNGNIDSNGDILSYVVFSFNWGQQIATDGYVYTINSSQRYVTYSTVYELYIHLEKRNADTGELVWEVNDVPRGNLDPLPPYPAYIGSGKFVLSGNYIYVVRSPDLACFSKTNGSLQWSVDTGTIENEWGGLAVDDDYIYVLSSTYSFVSYHVIRQFSRLNGNPGWSLVVNRTPQSSSGLSIKYYGGKLYYIENIFFESGWTGPPYAWSYHVGDLVSNNSTNYICIMYHTASALDEPGVGVNWTTYWSVAGIPGNYLNEVDTTTGTITNHVYLNNLWSAYGESFLAVDSTGRLFAVFTGNDYAVSEFFPIWDIYALLAEVDISSGILWQKDFRDYSPWPEYERMISTMEVSVSDSKILIAAKNGRGDLLIITDKSGHEITRKDWSNIYLGMFHWQLGIASAVIDNNGDVFSTGYYIFNYGYYYWGDTFINFNLVHKNWENLPEPTKWMNTWSNPTFNNYGTVRDDVIGNYTADKTSLSFLDFGGNPVTCDDSGVYFVGYTLTDVSGILYKQERIQKVDKNNGEVLWSVLGDLVDKDYGKPLSITADGESIFECFKSGQKQIRIKRRNKLGNQVWSVDINNADDLVPTGIACGPAVNDGWLYVLYNIWNSPTVHKVRVAKLAKIDGSIATDNLLTPSIDFDGYQGFGIKWFDFDLYIAMAADSWGGGYIYSATPGSSGVWWGPEGMACTSLDVDASGAYATYVEMVSGNLNGAIRRYKLNGTKVGEGGDFNFFGHGESGAYTNIRIRDMRILIASYWVNSAPGMSIIPNAYQGCCTYFYKDDPTFFPLEYHDYNEAEFWNEVRGLASDYPNTYLESYFSPDFFSIYSGGYYQNSFVDSNNSQWVMKKNDYVFTDEYMDYIYPSISPDDSPSAGGALITLTAGNLYDPAMVYLVFWADPTHWFKTLDVTVLDERRLTFVTPPHDPDSALLLIYSGYGLKGVGQTSWFPGQYLIYYP